MGKWTIRSLAAGAIAASMPAMADVVTIGSLKDNTIFSEATGNSNGAGPGFFTGTTARGAVRRGLIAFDIAAAIPPSATIDSVSLTLFEGQGKFSTASVELHRLTSNWGEGASNAGSAGGTGTTAQPGDATWVDAFTGTAAWSNAGGDFDSTISAARDIGGPGQSYTWDSTPQLTADVRNWLGDPSTNFGWMLIGDEINSSTAKRFDTKEGFTPSQAPALTVTYSVPEPASLAMLAAGIAGFCARRRRRRHELIAYNIPRI